MGRMQYVASPSPFGASGGVKQEAELVDTAAVAGIVGVGEFRRECSGSVLTSGRGLGMISTTRHVICKGL